MKKIITFIAISLFTTSSAFAADSFTLNLTDTGKTVYGGKTAATADTQHIIGKTSTGVGLGIEVDATAGAGYSLATQHKNGTKAYGSAFDSTSIFTLDATAGTAVTVTLTTGSTQFSSWTTM
jgi:hypothetical protein